MKAKTASTSDKGTATTKAITRALRRSARQARVVARMHGTPSYVLKGGKIVAIKP